MGAEAEEQGDDIEKYINTLIAYESHSQRPAKIILVLTPRKTQVSFISEILNHTYMTYEFIVICMCIIFAFLIYYFEEIRKIDK